MEKQIDEVCRMLRDYIETGYGDVRLGKLLFGLMKEMYLIKYLSALSKYHIPIYCDSANQLIEYFKQSLRREFKEPEVMNRMRSGREVYLESTYPHNYEWRPLNEK